MIAKLPTCYFVTKAFIFLSLRDSVFLYCMATHCTASLLSSQQDGARHLP